MNIFPSFKKKKDDDILECCAYILQYYHVKYTRSKLISLLKSHLEYPSLLSVKETLLYYGIQSAAIRKRDYDYEDFEVPFICPIQKEGWPDASFAVVLSVENSLLSYFDPFSSRNFTVSLGEFQKIDKEIILLLDGESIKHEENYHENQRQGRLKTITAWLPLVILVCITLLSIIINWRTENSAFKFIGILFTVTSFLGILASILLISHDIDSHNPFVKEVCGALGKKSDCNAVLSSDQSKFLNISWTVWGAAYFLTFYLSIAFFGGQIGNLVLWAILSLLISPFILFSLHYQYYIVKHWCTLCLAVQGIIGMNAFVSLIYIEAIYSNANTILFHELSLIVLSGAGILFMLSYLIPTVKASKDRDDLEMKWRKLRYNSDIFHSLLNKTERIRESTLELGIILGNENAEIEIIKVCNPYCGPCAKAHPELEYIIENNSNVRLRIIFTASGLPDDERTAPVLHLMAIQEEYGREKVHDALNDWYLSKDKDYVAFSSKYPLKSHLNEHKAKVMAMRKWCDRTRIRETPTIFINGHQLPESYNIKDLKNFF